MSTKNEHLARIQESKKYTSFSRKNIKGGLDVILGINDNTSEVQSYAFQATEYTIDRARKWLKDNKINYISFEAAIQSMKRNIQGFLGKIQALSKDDILQMVSKETIDEIKKKDAHPYFQAYSIAHEGVAKPKVLGDTQAPQIRFLRDAIQSIKNVITKGVKIF